MNQNADMSLQNVAFEKAPEIGSFEQGWQITEVREDGIVFACPAKLPDEKIEELKAHFAKPKKQRGFIMRPGRRIGFLKKLYHC